jgi:hypothetical protein
MSGEKSAASKACSQKMSSLGRNGGALALDHSEGVKYEEPGDKPDEQAGEHRDELLSWLHPY